MCLYPKERDVKCRDGVTRVLVTRCGKCVECQKAYSNEWALRLYHERRYHLYTFFLTLTYDDVHLPADGQLKKKDIQDFILRLKEVVDFRYFLCGEYGGKGGRPHYHVLIFTDDIEPFDFLNTKVDKYAVSLLVSSLWKNGFHSVELNVQFATLKYVAKYMQKSRMEDFPKDFQKPFLLMSHKPYIGLREDDLLKWYMQRNGDDKFYVDGFPYAIPNFYNQVLQRNGIVLDKIYSERRLSRSDDACKERVAHADAVIRKLNRPIISI